MGETDRLIPRLDEEEVDKRTVTTDHADIDRVRLLLLVLEMNSVVL